MRAGWRLRILPALTRLRVGPWRRGSRAEPQSESERRSGPESLPVARSLRRRLARLKRFPRVSSADQDMIPQLGRIRVPCGPVGDCGYYRHGPDSESARGDESRGLAGHWALSQSSRGGPRGLSHCHGAGFRFSAATQVCGGQLSRSGHDRPHPSPVPAGRDAGRQDLAFCGSGWNRGGAYGPDTHWSWPALRGGAPPRSSGLAAGIAPQHTCKISSRNVEILC